MSKNYLTLAEMKELVKEASPEEKEVVKFAEKLLLLYNKTESLELYRMDKKYRDANWNAKRFELAVIMMAEKLYELGFRPKSYCQTVCKATKEEIESGNFCKHCIKNYFVGLSTMDLDRDKGE